MKVTCLCVKHNIFKRIEYLRGRLIHICTVPNELTFFQHQQHQVSEVNIILHRYETIPKLQRISFFQNFSTQRNIFLIINSRQDSILDHFMSVEGHKLIAIRSQIDLFCQVSGPHTLNAQEFGHLKFELNGLTSFTGKVNSYKISVKR